MATQRLVGSRIREKRLDRGLRQASVAETVGISPSYLNLIEHNRRRIGGKLIADLARVLDVDTALLTDGADTEMLDQMRSAAASNASEAEVDRTEEMAARYPGWSALIASQTRRIAALEEQVRVLTDRMAYDPQLAGSLHEVISAVSAIRSSASILVGPEELDRDWQRRFHENIHNDSVRLASSSEALITYLEAPEAVVDHASSPFEQVEKYLSKNGYHLSALETPDANPMRVVADAGLSGSAALLLQDLAKRYINDATTLPLGPFQTACRKHGYDPAALARVFDAPLTTVMRRLAQLPPDHDHPPIGIAICDAAGVLPYLKPAAGFVLPRSGGVCPLWPLYGALGRPAQPVRVDVVLPGPNPTRMLCYAVAEPLEPTQFDKMPALQSTMLVMPDPPQIASEPQPIGISCRICPRTDCNSRREPALMGAGTANSALTVS